MKKTEEEIRQIIELYDELGVYSKVAKKLGIAASTVSKYVKEAKNLKLAQNSIIPFDAKIPKINEIPFPDDLEKILELSKEEWNELKELQKEIILD